MFRLTAASLRRGGYAENDHWWSLTTAGAAATIGKEVQIDFDLYVVGALGSTRAGIDLISCTDKSYGNPGFDITFKEDGTISAYYSGEGHTVGGTFATDTWQHVSITANFDVTKSNFTASIGSLSVPIENRLSFSGGMRGGSSIKEIDLYTSNTGTTGYFYDNVVIHAVPEPSTMALLTIGLMGLSTYAWRKRK